MALGFALFEEYRFLTELLAAQLMLLLPACKRRAHFKIRFFCGLAAIFAFSHLYLLIHRSFSLDISYGMVMLLHMGWYIFLALLTGGFIGLCFQLNYVEVFWFLSLAYAMQHIVYLLINIIVFTGFGVGLKDNAWWAYAILSLALCVPFYVLFYKIFAPFVGREQQLQLHDQWKTRLLYTGMSLAFFVTTLLNQWQVETADLGPMQFNYVSLIAGLVICFLVLGMRYENLRMRRLYVEKAVTTQLYEQAVRQYKAFQKSVDYVNIKIHDFKARVRALESEGGLSSQAVADVLDRVEIYESFASTGNKALDILLTKYALYCRDHSIAFFFRADAEGDNAIERSDLYALFCNVLDNAIEHVKQYDDEQRRFVRLGVKQTAKLLIINAENYFSGELKLEGGLPATTKADKINHGYGLLSIKSIAEKYNGCLSIGAKDNLFQIDILLQTQQ